MNSNRYAAAFSCLFVLVAAVFLGCSRGVPVPERPTPSGTGIPSPYPAAYAWVRAQLDGALRGEFLTGDPQDKFERIRGRVVNEELAVEIGFPSRGVRFRTPPLRGGVRYVLGNNEGYFALVIDGKEWSTEQGGVCSIIFSYVRGPQIPLAVPEGYRVFEVDAGFVCVALKATSRVLHTLRGSESGVDGSGNEKESPIAGTQSLSPSTDKNLSVTEGRLHFFFAVPPRTQQSPDDNNPFGFYRTNTPTTAPTGPSR